VFCTAPRQGFKIVDENEDNVSRLEDLEDFTSTKSLEPLGELKTEKLYQTTGFNREQFQTKGHVAVPLCYLQTTYLFVHSTSGGHQGLETLQEQK